MRKIPREQIEQVKETVDIVDVIQQYVSLKRSGSEYKALCPFHREETPSFTVVPDKQFYYCFGCTAHGDVIQFLVEYEGVSFVEAIEMLAEQSGARIDVEVEKESEEYQALQLNQQVMEYYNELHPDLVQRFLKSRACDPKLQEVYNIALVGEKGSGLVQRFRPQLDLLVQLGLVFEDSQNERFRGRIVFPIVHQRYPSGFGGRRLREYQKAKYVNSPESFIYNKSHALFGLSQAKPAIRKSKAVYLVEGYMDVLALRTAGIENVVATCGTAVTSRQIRLLTNMVERLYPIFDMDEAGKKAAFQATNLALRFGCIPYLSSLPEGQDPGDVLEESGAKALRKRVEDATVYYAYFNQMVAGYPLERKIDMVKKFDEATKAIIDDVTRQVVRREMGEYFGVDLARPKQSAPNYEPKSLDRQALEYLLQPKAGRQLTRMLTPDDFLEQSALFGYIFDAYACDETPHASELIEAFPGAEEYISSAYQSRKTSTLEAIANLAMRIRQRTLRNQLSVLADKEETEGDLSPQEEQRWRDLRLRLRVLSKLDVAPPFPKE